MRFRFFIWRHEARPEKREPSDSLIARESVADAVVTLYEVAFSLLQWLQRLSLMQKDVLQDWQLAMNDLQ